VCERETAVIGPIAKLYSYVTEDTLRHHYKKQTARAILRTDRWSLRQLRHQLERIVQLHSLTALPHGRNRRYPCNRRLGGC